MEDFQEKSTESTSQSGMGLAGNSERLSDLRLLLVGNAATRKLLLNRDSSPLNKSDWNYDLVFPNDELFSLIDQDAHDLLVLDQQIGDQVCDSILSWCRQNRPQLPVLYLDQAQETIGDKASENSNTGESGADKQDCFCGDTSQFSFSCIQTRQVYEAINDVMGSLDENGFIKTISQRIFNLTGCTASDLIGRPFINLIVPEERPAISECLSMVGQGQRARCDMRMIGKNGEWIGSATFATPPNPSSDQNGLVFVINDVTTERSAQLQLIQVNQDLRQDRNRLHRLATTDELTRLYNRRYGQELLNNLVEQSIRYGHPISFVMIDLDNFKQLNDAYGHPFGDLVLQKVSSLLANSVRRSDIAMRYGGEEIALILPNTIEIDAFRLVERLRTKCGQMEIANDLEPIFATFSAGIATFSTDGIHDSFSLIQKADDYLYLAKMQGRNNCVSRSFGHKDDSLLDQQNETGSQQRIFERFQALAEQHNRSQLALLRSLINSLEMKSSYTAKHCQQVMVLAKKLALAIGMNAELAERIECAGYLHDIGLIAVPELTLHKPGKLEDSDWDLIHQHPAWGQKMLAKAPMLVEERTWIEQHHERIDGTGYPNRHRGKQISLPAQVLSVADVYSAMVCDRPYRKAFSHQEALSRIDDLAGTCFDRDLVDSLIGQFV